MAQRTTRNSHNPHCIRPRLDAEELKAIEVPGDRAFTESITAGPDGTLYLSSLASGGIARVKPGASKPRRGSRREPSKAARRLESLPTPRQTPYGSVRIMCRVWASLAQVLRQAITLWLHLATGDGKISAQFPGKANICNDMTVASDGTVYVTNSLTHKSCN